MNTDQVKTENFEESGANGNGQQESHGTAGSNLQDFSSDVNYANDSSEDQTGGGMDNEFYQGGENNPDNYVDYGHGGHGHDDGSGNQDYGQDSTSTYRMKNKDDDKRKLFVGGLSWDTKEKDLKEYFSKFGEVEGLTYKTDAVTGRPRGFAFIIFTELSSVEQVLATGEHVINGKKVDPKRAKARPGKIFVGGLTSDISTEDVKEYFAKFGNVVDMEVPIDKLTNNRKNYCFVTFDDISVSQELLRSPKQTICGKEVDIKQAVPMAKGGQGGGWNDSHSGMRGGRGRGSGMRGRGGGWGGGYGAPSYAYYNYNFPAYSSWGAGGYGDGGSGYGGYDYDGYYGYDAYSGYESYPRGGYGRGGGYAGKMRGSSRGGVARHTPY